MQKQATHGTQSMGFYFYFYFIPFSSPNSQPSSQCHKAHPLRWVGLPSNLHHFFFSLIDMGLFKDRVVAMGKPHCNYSI
jgi:hypothetical protein